MRRIFIIRFLTRVKVTWSGGQEAEKESKPWWGLVLRSSLGSRTIVRKNRKSWNSNYYRYLSSALYLLLIWASFQGHTSHSGRLSSHTLVPAQSSIFVRPKITASCIDQFVSASESDIIFESKMVTAQEISADLFSIYLYHCIGSPFTLCLGGKQLPRRLYLSRYTRFSFNGFAGVCFFCRVSWAYHYFGVRCAIILYLPYIYFLCTSITCVLITSCDSTKSCTQMLPYRYCKFYHCFYPSIEMFLLQSDRIFQRLNCSNRCEYSRGRAGGRGGWWKTKIFYFTRFFFSSSHRSMRFSSPSFHCAVSSL